MNLRNRIKALEERIRPATRVGRTRWLDLYVDEHHDPLNEEEAAKLASAEAEHEPGDLLVIVELPGETEAG